MPRMRTIHPSFFQDADIIRVGPDIAYLFLGLLCYADREGRLIDAPRDLKQWICPGNDIDADKALEVLAKPKLDKEYGFIHRYCVGKRKYIQILGWYRWGRPFWNEPPSQIPPPSDEIVEMMREPHVSTRLREAHEQRKADKTVEKITEIETWFEQAIGMYPKPVGKEKAQMSFLATVHNQKDWERFQIALKHYLASERAKKGILQDASTWFSQWRDWVDYEEKLCDKCKGKGHYMSTTGFEVRCDCPASLRWKGPKG